MDFQGLASAEHRAVRIVKSKGLQQGEGVELQPDMLFENLIGGIKDVFLFDPWRT